MLSQIASRGVDYYRSCRMWLPQHMWWSMPVVERPWTQLCLYLRLLHMPIWMVHRMHHKPMSSRQAVSPQAIRKHPHTHS